MQAVDRGRRNTEGQVRMRLATFHRDETIGEVAADRNRYAVAVFIEGNRLAMHFRAFIALLICLIVAELRTVRGRELPGERTYRWTQALAVHPPAHSTALCR